MSVMNISRLSDTPYQVVQVVADTDTRTKPDDDTKDQYADSVRYVLEFDINTVQAFEVIDGLSVFSSIDNVYFQGAGPFTIAPPTGWGSLILVRQSLNAVEVSGSKFLRVTEEYITRDVDASGNPNWQDFNYS